MERAFITRGAAQGILGMNGVTPANQANQLMNSVFAVVGSSDDKRRRSKFDKFVAIFRREPAYADLVRILSDAVE